MKSTSWISLSIVIGVSVLSYGISPIIISDGPGSTQELSRSGSNIVISDGPSTPSEKSASLKPNSIVISDGPQTEAKKPDASVPEPVVSTLAPLMPQAGSVQVLPTPSKTPGVGISSTWHGTHAVSKEPFYIFSDKGNSGNHYVPGGWMGDYGDIQFSDASHVNPHSGHTCIKIAYAAKSSQGNGWASMYWQAPANNWGDKPGGYDLTGKRRLTFWARGEKGGEVISEFKMGGISGENGDTDSAGTGSIVLSREWKKYTIGLADKNLTNIIGGFCWSANRDSNPDGMIFYLDDIRYE